ncbi:MAG: hypothetical protein ACP5F1_00115 [Thermoplasmata archaeon]|nr:hypothetical protein [Thermoplasmata archaeon]
MIKEFFIDEIVAIREKEKTVTSLKFTVTFDSLKKDNEVLDIYYTFSALYEDSENSKVGEIRLVGHLIDKEENEEMAKMVNDYWNTKKSLPKGLLDKVLNVLNFECGARGTLVAYAMAFPPPIPLGKS